jgi:caspase domain-containing protein
MSGRRWAVLAGIDEYPNLRADQQLAGCINDVELMAALLPERFGFSSDGITLLRNAEASRKAILDALDGLVAKAEADDVVVVHYSGHGSQMTDREGDEGDGLDETIVPADSGRGDAENRDITDDEIYAWLTRLTARTNLVTLVFDCCHSGSVTRDLAGARSRRIEPDTRAASELPPSPVQSTRAARAAGPSGWLPPGRRYTLLAGCRDEELSFEHDEPGADTHGALTWFLTRALTAAQPGATYRDVFEVAAAGVSAAYPSQHPQIEGAVNREVFGVAEFVPAAFVAVLSRHGETVTLGGGAAQGLGPGSRWGAYPAGTLRPSREQRLGTLRVTAAQATSATANVEDETTLGAIAEQARAIRESQEPDAPRMRVAVPEELTDLRALVDESTLIERVDGDGTADARILTVAPRAEPRGDDPVPQLGAVGRATVAVVGADGRLMIPDRPADAADTARKVHGDLETVARYRRVLALENPASGLEGVVELTLLRRGADGSWVAAEPEVAGGEVVFEEGEQIGVRIRNTHNATLYPAVLDLGLAYGVSPVHPYAGNEALGAGATVELGTRPGQEIELGIPAAFPFGGDSDDSDQGVETVKLFVTAEPADYTVLHQAGVEREIDRRRGGTRDFLQRTAEDDWTTSSGSFLLRRATRGVVLEAGGGTVHAGDVELSTPGLNGRVAALDPGGGGRTRALDLSTDALEDVLGAEGLDVQIALDLSDVERASGTRGAEPAIEVRPPAPAPGEGQMLLAKDEAGVLTWHFAGATRGLDDERRTYRIDRRVVVSVPAEVGTRGLAAAIGKKLLKVLVFPLIEPAIGEVADFFAGRWEAKKRPYRLRHSNPDDFATPGGRDVQAADWDELSGRRTLLLVHGTFSRSHSGFGQLPRETFEQLYRHYEGRVLALDHFTLSHTPRQNVEWLIGQIAEGRRLDVDILCHSRGGLVSRTLVEQQSELSLGSKGVSVGRVVFVATPNAGTALADGEHLGDLVDTYTNVLNFIPDNGVTDVLEGVVTVAKMLAVGAMKGLDGLASMVPDGDFQKWLNAGPAPVGTTYCALAADYEPTIPALADFARDWVMDKVFAKLGNDLVVPTDGVFAENGAGLFPIDDRHVFAKEDGVAHTRFFADRTTQDKLVSWLDGG